MVNMNYPCAEPTTINIRDWSREIKNKLFGKQLRRRLEDVFNNNLFQLMNPGKNRDGMKKEHFGLRIHQPITKKDVERVLLKQWGLHEDDGRW